MAVFLSGQKACSAGCRLTRSPWRLCSSPQYLAYRSLTLWACQSRPAFFFLACICFYFLALALRINPMSGIITALAFGYSTYNPAILAVGHETRCKPSPYLPGFLASLVLIFEKKYLTGLAALTAFFAISSRRQSPPDRLLWTDHCAFMTWPT